MSRAKGRCPCCRRYVYTWRDLKGCPECLAEQATGLGSWAREIRMQRRATREEVFTDQLSLAEAGDGVESPVSGVEAGAPPAPGLH